MLAISHACMLYIHIDVLYLSGYCLKYGLIILINVVKIL